jgi:hypothetical protein
MTQYNYPQSSAYSATPQASWYIGRYVHRSIPADVSDTTYIVPASYQYRPDLLANELYGTPLYWWVFMSRNINLIRDPIWDFKAGLTIMVPTVGQLTSL